MVTCPTCNDSASVQIAAAPGGGSPTAPHWRARCDDCGMEWGFSDPD